MIIVESIGSWKYDAHLRKFTWSQEFALTELKLDFCDHEDRVVTNKIMGLCIGVLSLGALSESCYMDVPITHV